MKYIEATPKQCQSLNLEYLDWDFDESRLVTDDINRLSEECAALGVAVAIDNGTLKILVSEASAEALGVDIGSESDLEELESSGDDDLGSNSASMTKEETQKYVQDYVDARIKQVLEDNEVITRDKLEKILRLV